MRKLAIAGIVSLAFFASGCAQVQNTWERLTSVQVNASDVYIAENTFDAIEITAKNYLHYCSSVQPTSPVCKKEAIAQLIPAVRSGRIARVQLDTFVKAHPDALGAKGLYDALLAATSTVQQISVQYNISGVK